jgi:5-formyltetrahydrofolate cyclo-ligase
MHSDKIKLRSFLTTLYFSGDVGVISKSEQRRLAYDARNAQLNKQQISQQILNTLYTTETYQQAEVVLWYLHCRSEVETILAVKIALEKQDKKIVIPYCTKDAQGNNKLGLWHLENFDELVSGTWGIFLISFGNSPQRSTGGSKIPHVPLTNSSKFSKCQSPSLLFPCASFVQ